MPGVDLVDAIIALWNALLQGQERSHLPNLWSPVRASEYAIASWTRWIFGHRKVPAGQTRLVCVNAAAYALSVGNG